MNPITVLDQGNVPQGPFTREQIAEKLRSGEIMLTQLAFAEGVGLAHWTELRDVLARIDGSPAPPPPTGPPPVPVVTAPEPSAYSYAATMAPPSHLQYAGFWIRFVAYLIDGVIISAAMLGVVFVLAIIFTIIGVTTGLTLKEFEEASQNGPSPTALVLVGVAELLLSVSSVSIGWLYFALLESSSGQSTFGKRAMGLRVTDIAGQRITFGRASGRFFGKIVSSMTFYIGFIMAAFTERKQALHDMIAGTLVVKS